MISALTRQSTARASKRIWKQSCRPSTSAARVGDEQRSDNSRSLTPAERNEASLSNSLSFASPDSDFCSIPLPNSKLPYRTEWSSSLSFASPESDFIGVNADIETPSRSFHPSSRTALNGSSVKETVWPNDLSFASPENDFTAADINADRGRSEWSGTLSLTSPESDFTSANLEDSPAIKTEWSHAISFASPECDFVAQDVATSDLLNTEWSSALSFASPESDFLSEHTANAESLTTEWSQELSFGSPESDFSARAVASSPVMESEWSNELSFASPESDFAAVNSQNDEAVSAEWSQLLSFASPESDFTTEHALVEGIVASSSKRSTLATPAEHPLPRDISQAMSDSRPLVITSSVSPFKVIHVNDAWEGLCGYTAEEAIGHRIGDLLQGPATNKPHADGLVDRLHREEYAEAVLTNYTKTGRQFENMLRLAPIRNDDGAIEHFIGVMEEVHEDSSRENLIQS